MNDSVKDGWAILFLCLALQHVNSSWAIKYKVSYFARSYMINHYFFQSLLFIQIIAPQFLGFKYLYLILIIIKQISLNCRWDLNRYFALPTGVRLRHMYSLHTAKIPKKRVVPSMTLNYVWLWGFSSGNLVKHGISLHCHYSQVHS